MPRTARIFIENACYHIIVRGSQKEAVFKDSADYEYYLRLLHKYKLKYGCLIYGYCLMNNHVHLILDSPARAENISLFMHGLNLSYAMKFNSKYDQCGHLWQNRYKIFAVLKNDYMLNLISYIEYNPVKAKIVLCPENYPYSSYKYRLLDEKNIILDQFKL